MHTKFHRGMTAALFVAGLLALFPGRTQAAETLCDPSFQNCRTQLLSLIDNEKVAIDVAFWFMEDQRYVSHIINRFNAGVRVRLIIDPRANATYTLNKTSLDTFQAAGIPMIKKASGGIMHWKTMIFAGQNVVEFGSANYSDNAFVPVSAYTNYVSETIFYEDDPAIVQSFERKYDDLWIDTTNYLAYANLSSRTRSYPLYTISADMNFPPGQGYASRVIGRIKAETQQIDVDMYRITQQAEGDAIIAMFKAGVPVRYMGETREYRLASRLWVAYNMDRIYAAGIPMRVRASAGEYHEKLVLLYGQGMSVFGSSNWTSPSDNSQQEHNYFTTKSWMFQWFKDQYNRKWNNSNPINATETTPFVPLPPDKPVNKTPANAATGVGTSGIVLKWYGGPWAHLYDVYFGTNPNPPLLAADQALGPSQTTTQNQSFTLPTLQAGTTYYWKIVSKTMAKLTATGPVWSFTTSGTAPPPPSPSGTTIVLYGSNTAAGDIHGNWQKLADAAAAGGAAMWNPDAGAAKVSPALASPTNYFEQTFTASASTAYHLWIRLRAQNNSLANDSIHVQFSDSVDSGGAATMRIGSTSSAAVVLQAGSSDPSDIGYGWIDNGWGSLGANIFFATTGTHTIRIQQREDGAIVDQIVLSPDTYLTTAPGPNDNDTTILPANSGGGSSPPPPSPLPSGWSTTDIGSVGLAGSASYSNGTFTVQGAGADIWGTADAFRYTCEQLAGDGSIVARVATVQNVNAWTKAGVMIRQTLNANSAHASMFVTPGKGLAFQRRQSAGATSLNTSVAGTAPRWVQIGRAGQVVTASVSTDGTTWTQVGQDTIALSGAVWIGLAITSHDATQLATATIDSVTVTPTTTASLPAGWQHTDIGAVAIAGSASYSNGTFTVKASGADIWNTADATTAAIDSVG